MTKKKTQQLPTGSQYDGLLSSVTDLLQQARRSGARAINAILTATYWEIGRRIVEFEQQGHGKAAYGEQVIDRLAEDLTNRFGRGFGRRNLFQIRAFFLDWNPGYIRQTLSGNSGIVQTLSAHSEAAMTAKMQIPSAQFTLEELSVAFPLPWSQYVRLLSVKSPEARAFYESEAIRGGWSVRQLDRQIAAQFFERTALSRNKAAMLTKGSKPQPGDKLTPEEEIKDPYVLEFLGLKDEYSENELEQALILHLERFLLELGGDFAFIGRQKRLRVGNEWYRVDLLFFHRKLKCLVVIDLKVGKFTHADAGQMHLYLNYAREHWVNDGENPPVGLILCAEKDSAVAKYALEGLPNKVLAAEYKLVLPDEKKLIREIETTRKKLSRGGQ
ncbi:MAG: PDDEXK nuclease domain-containing protein [Ignavibacteriales bacterium]|nr:PDDEXK nuclease domain-containing protein [Ignavibacteriales bacterium]